MTAPADCQSIGRGNTIQTDLRDRGHLSPGGAAIFKVKRAPSSTAC
jgi:hypothetical protein